MSDLAEICNFYFLFFYLQKERRYQKYGVSEAYLKMVTLLKMRVKLTLQHLQSQVQFLISS